MRRDLHPGRRLLAIGAAVLVVAGLGFLTFQLLGSSAEYFRNVDEAVAQQDDLGDRRFRLQGRVVPASVEPTADGVRFELEHNCVLAAVQHRGDPPELFDNPWIPVVVVGSWQDEPAQLVFGTDDHVFHSDQLIVKHTNEYAAANSERVQTELPEDELAGCPPDLVTALQAGT
jgi:cytochrome c-type biogenesis protein CcmE